MKDDVRPMTGAAGGQQWNTSLAMSGSSIKTGIRQSRSCGLEESEGALWVPGVVSVGCGDVVVSVQA